MKKKEVDCDPNAVRVRHLVEFLRGKIPVDSSCTNGDLLCFALHMIMIDSGYQPNVSCLLTPSHTHSLTSLTTHTLTPSLHPLTHTLTHSVPTHSLTHTVVMMTPSSMSSKSHSFSYSLSDVTHSSTHSRPTPRISASGESNSFLL